LYRAGFADDYGVGVVEFVVIAKGVFGMPHTCDSVVLTNLSFGLLGSHIGFWPGFAATCA
jgi:hypothetical protein